MTDWIRYFSWTFVSLFIIGVAIWRGGRPERTIAVAMVIASFATPIAQMRPLSNNPDVGVFAVDLALLAVMIWVSLRSDRWWPLFATAFHLISVAIHIVKLTRPDTAQAIYATSRIAFSYLSIYALGAGVLELEWRRRRQRRQA